MVSDAEQDFAALANLGVRPGEARKLADMVDPAGVARLAIDAVSPETTETQRFLEKLLDPTNAPQRGSYEHGVLSLLALRIAEVVGGTVVRRDTPRGGAV